MNTRTTTRRRLAPVVVGTALAGALVIGAPLAAQAHVTVSPDSAAPGDSGILTFAFSHGCDLSPTASLRIGMPETGLDAVTPTVLAGWDVEVERSQETGIVSAVTYTADEPVADGLRAAVDLAVRYSPDAPESLVFPVEQTCEEGSTSWSEVAEDGEDPHDLASPAPVVTLTGEAEAAAGGHHDGDEGAAAASEESSAGADGPAAQGAALPVALGAGGLAAGLAALVVSVLAYRRGARR
jgi:uncharacterized protein YcnI